MEPALSYVTDFADQAVALPILVLVAAVLLVQRRWRLGAAWLLAICGVLGVVLVLKIVLFACGWLLPSLGEPQLALISPSGHTASAVVEYGSLFVMFGARPGPSTRRVQANAVLTGLAIALVIGFTRVGLGAHTLIEVLVAAMVGVMGIIAFVRLAGPSLLGTPKVPAWVAGLLAAALFHGQHLPAEAMIQSHTVALVRFYAPVCDLPR